MKGEKVVDSAGESDHRVDNNRESVSTSHLPSAQSALSLRAGVFRAVSTAFFQITLVPRENASSETNPQLRNDWVLRCDTEDEMRIWLGIIKTLCPSCF